MLRKVVIVVLTLAAVSTMLLWGWNSGRAYYIMPKGCQPKVIRADVPKFHWLGPSPEWHLQSSPFIMSIQARPWNPTPGKTYYLPNVFLLSMFATGTYPTYALITGPMRRWRRRRKRCCQQCGYSLIGNLSGVCPECGTEVAKPRSGDRSVARGVNGG